MAHIFLSYPHSEKEFATPLAAELKNRGIKIWMDRMDGLKGGHNWRKEIAAAIDNSLAMLVILCPDYLSSKYCQQELHRADRLNIPLFPILLRHISPREYPLELEGIQYVDFINWRDAVFFGQKIIELIGGIQNQNIWFSQINKEISKVLIGPPPSTQEQYLNSLIADLEARTGVLEYVELSTQAEVGDDELSRPNPSEEESHLAEYAILEQEDEEVSSTHVLDQEKRPLSSIREALELFDRFVLIGEPGAGKTTTIRRLALDAAHKCLNKENDAPLPLLLYLPSWGDEDTPEAFVSNHWKLDGNPIEMLHRGKLLLYLDGLNEMGATGPEKAKKLRKWLESDHAPQKVIVTCRQADYSVQLNLALPAVLAEEMDEARIEQFAKNYLSDKAPSFLQRILPKGKREKESSRHLFRLSRNPYLLAALIYVYNNSENQELPRNTGALFQLLVKLLWEREQKRGTKGWIPFNEMEHRFSELAFAMINEEQPIDVPKHYALKRLIDDALLITGQSANIIEVRGDDVRFFHQLMMEYFAAVGMEKQSVSNYLTRPRLDFITGRVANKWDQVIIAMCGIASNPSIRVQDILEKDPFLSAECIASGVNITAQIQAETLSALMKRMTSFDLLGQKASIRAVALIGPEAVPDVLQALQHEKDSVRDTAAKTLGLIGDSRAVPGLIIALQDKDPLVKRSATRALEQIGDSSAVPALLKTLGDPDKRVQSNAARALGKLGKAAIPGLLQALRMDDNDIQRAAANALRGLADAETVPDLVLCLQDDSSEVRRAVVSALEAIKTDAAIAGLVQALRDKDDSVRLRTVVALRQMDYVPDSLTNVIEFNIAAGELESLSQFNTNLISGRATILRLIEILFDHHYQKMHYQIRPLLKQFSPQILAESFLTNLASMNPQIAGFASYELLSPSLLASLQSVSLSESQLKQIFLSACQHSDKQIQKNLIIIARQLNKEIGINTLLQLYQTNDDEIKTLVVHKFLEWVDPAVGPYLLNDFNDDHMTIIPLLAQLLAMLDFSANLDEITPTPNLQQVIKHNDEQVRKNLVSVFGKMEGNIARACLFQMFKDGNNEIRKSVLEQLRVKKEPAISQQLVQLLHSSPTNIQVMIIETLATIADNAISAEVFSFWQQEKLPPAVKNAGALLLQKIGDSEKQKLASEWLEQSIRRPGRMQVVKIVVTGPFSSGKTQLIQELSEIDIVSTDRKVLDTSPEAQEKEITTVAMDFGRITLADDLVLYLFGTPGQRRFDFMWEILAEGMLGFVVMVDSAKPETFREAKSILETFRAYAPTPYVVAANKQDHPDAWSPDDLRIALRIEDSIKVIPCVAKDKESAKVVLLELIYSVLEEMEA